MERRRTVLVDRPMQFGFLASWLVASSIVVVTAIVFVFLREFTLRATGTGAQPDDSSLLLLSHLGAFLFFLAVVILGVNVLIQSQRVAGPAVAIERAIRRLRLGEGDASVSLRKQDYLHTLATEVNGLITDLSAQRLVLQDIREDARRLDEEARQRPLDPEIRHLCHELATRLEQVSDPTAR